MSIEHLGPELRRWAARAAPREACGLLLAGPPALVPLENCAEFPERGFALDPLELLSALRAAGPRARGVVHSHPSGDLAPSSADLEGARALGGLEAWVVVVVEGDVRARRYH